MTILCYHSVESGWASPLAVPPGEFARHGAWLAANRKVLELSRAVELLDSSFRLPRGATALTFDDGFGSLFDKALPVILRCRLPATAFLVAETLTPSGRAVDWVDNPPADPIRTLTLDQVLEMQRAGVRFGSHSYSHRDLPLLEERECERDLRTSRETLEDLLGRPVPFLAYPRGRHDERVRRAAQRAGFTHAFTLPEKHEPVGRFAVPRVGVYPGNGAAALRAKTSRAYLSIRASAAFPMLRSLVRGRRGSPPSLQG